jgi:RNA-directed DNA polymerase
MDYLLYLKLRRWAARKSKSAKQGNKFWATVGSRKWVFKSSEMTLVNHQDYSKPINDYVKVKGDASPYDGQRLYWVFTLPFAKPIFDAPLRRES